jgi:hypothetical protein
MESGGVSRRSCVPRASFAKQRAQKSAVIYNETADMNRMPAKCKPCKNRVLTGMMAVLLAAVSFAHAARAISPYLPFTGMPPLRFEVLTTNSFNYLAFSQQLPALEAKLANASSNALLAANSDTKVNTNSLANSSPVAVPVVSSKTGANSPDVYISTSQGNASDQEKNSSQPLNFAFPSPSASDLLTVTPQMLTQYLRPEQNETNQVDQPGAVVFVPADLPFMPPTQASSPESRAVYQSR